MASILRRPQNIARSSRQLIEAASLSQTLARRPAGIPRPLYAYARSRQYSTQKPDSEHDGKSDKTPGSAPKGMENLYNQSPMSPGGQPPDPNKKPEDEGPLPGRSKLNAQEEKALDDVFAMVKKGMPHSMTQDIDKAIARIKKDGMPEEL
ncbi:hypothetical protein KC352_g45995, partial [Hortaea werneckii]